MVSCNIISIFVLHVLFKRMAVMSSLRLAGSISWMLDMSGPQADLTE